MPKMKTHRGAAKRFKVTGTGKLRRLQINNNHILEKKAPKRMRRLQGRDRPSPPATRPASSGCSAARPQPTTSGRNEAMARVKRAVHSKKHRRATLERAKGYYGNKSRSYSAANEQVMHSLQYAFRDRRARKGDFRSLWIQRINAACRENGTSLQPVHRRAPPGRDRGRPQGPGRPRRARAGRVRGARPGGRRGVGQGERLTDGDPIGSRHPSVQRLRRLSRRRAARSEEGAFVVDGPAARAPRPSHAGIDVRRGARRAGERARAWSARAAGGGRHGAHRGRPRCWPRPSTPPRRRASAAVAARPDVDLDDAAGRGRGGPAGPRPGRRGRPRQRRHAAAGRGGAGAAAVLFCGASVDPCNPKCVRASAGALFHLPVASGGDAVAVLERPRGSGGAPGRPPSSATARRTTRPTSPAPSRSCSAARPTACPPTLDALVDERLTIPMAGRSESLNVAMAGTVLCFEALRQRRGVGVTDAPDRPAARRRARAPTPDGTLVALNAAAARRARRRGGRRSSAVRWARPSTCAAPGGAPALRDGWPAARRRARAHLPRAPTASTCPAAVTIRADDERGGRSRCGPSGRAQRHRGHLHRVPRAAQPAHVGEGLHVADAQPVGPAQGRAEAHDARAGPPRRRPRHPARHRAARHQPARDRPARAAPPDGRPRRSWPAPWSRRSAWASPTSTAPSRSPTTSRGSTPTPTRSSRCSPTWSRTPPSTAARSAMEVDGRGRRRRRWPSPCATPARASRPTTCPGCSRSSSGATTAGPTGTGLGLWISRGLVEAHGGRAHRRRPSSGEGSTFRFTLPARSRSSSSVDAEPIGGGLSADRRGCRSHARRHRPHRGGRRARGSPPRPPSTSCARSSRAARASARPLSR